MAIILISMFAQGMLIIPVINLTGVKTGYSTQSPSVENNQEEAISSKPVLSPLHIEERYIYPLVLKSSCFSPSTRKYMIDAYGVVEENGINPQTSGLLSSSSGGGRQITINNNMIILYISSQLIYFIFCFYLILNTIMLTYIYIYIYTIILYWC
jgi:hypothetical protein